MAQRLMASTGGSARPGAPGLGATYDICGEREHRTGLQLVRERRPEVYYQADTAGGSSVVSGARRLLLILGDCIDAASLGLGSGSWGDDAKIRDGS